jgi:hypothetical protein
MYMSLASSYLRSLILTSIFSFIAPLLLVGGATAGMVLLGFVPWLEGLSQIGLEQIKIFLQTFGNGNALEGSLVIGCACALVGGLFDTYIFYRQRSFRA